MSLKIILGLGLEIKITELKHVVLRKIQQIKIIIA